MSQSNPVDPPVKQTIVKNINSFTVNVRNVVLNTSADLEITLLNDTTFVDFRTVTLSGQDYLDWGANDTYIINWVTNWIRQNYESA
jgi:hypothetical protein